MPRWTWESDEVDADRCVLVDMDGVLADASHRQRFLDGPRKKWQDFFKAAVDDPPLLGGITWLDLLAEDLVTIIVTARPESIHDQTVEWLREYNISWDLLVMRGRADHGSAPEFKRLAVLELRAYGFDPVLAVDDDERIISMYLEEDIPTMYLHSGYYG